MIEERVPIFGSGNRRRPVFVLLVEDDRGDALIARRTVYGITETNSKYDYYLDHALSLKDAIAALNSEKYSMVLLDLSLVDAENLEAVDAIKRAFPEMPIIVLTNNDDKHTQLDAKIKGINAYLLKRHLINNPSAVAQALDSAIK